MAAQSLTSSYFVITVESVSGLQPGSPGSPLYATVVGPLTEAQFHSQYPNAGLIPNEPASGYPTQTAAQAAANQYNSQPASSRPGLPGVDAPGVAPGINSPLPNVPNPLSGLSGLLAPLFQKNIWLRVGEVALGVVLIAVAVNAMFDSRPLRAVTSTVGMAAKIVP